MFKMIGRILIILLVAAIVAGGIYLLVQNGSSNNTAFAPDRQFQGRTFGGTSNGNFASPDGFRGRDHEGQFSIGRGIGGLFGTTLKISVIVLLVLLVQNGLASLKSRRATGSA